MMADRARELVALLHDYFPVFVCGARATCVLREPRHSVINPIRRVVRHQSPTQSFGIGPGQRSLVSRYAYVSSS